MVKVSVYLGVIVIEFTEVRKFMIGNYWDLIVLVEFVVPGMHLNVM